VTVRVALVDDHPVFRIGMTALLGSLPGVEVAGTAAGAAEARAMLVDAALPADVVVMDLDLGDGSGVDVTREVLASRPELAVLVMSMHEDDDAVVAAVRAGARGYLVKSAPPDQVERAVRAVAAGEMILGPTVAARAMAYVLAGRTAVRVPFPRLTDREREVLDQVAAGHDNVVIARRLGLSAKTVRNHIANVLTKLEVPDRSAAILRARAEGLGGAPADALGPGTRVRP
jgi:DNA-binding NarL/FixJ family response regulator